MSAEDLVTLLLSRGQPAREEENDEEDDDLYSPPDPAHLGKALRSHVEQLRALPYAEYLKTDHWQKERTGALKRAGYHCQVCRATGVQLDVHHNTYARLGCEEPGDLLVLCGGCHELFSKSGSLAEGKRGGMEDIPDNFSPDEDEDFEDDQDQDLDDNPILPTRYAIRVSRSKNEPQNGQKKDLRDTRIVELPSGWTEKDVELAKLVFPNIRNRDLTLKAIGKTTTPDNRRSLAAILKQEGLIEEGE
jgi:hypothetical protein